MNRSTRLLAVIGFLCVATLFVTPSAPAVADSPLAGYTAAAESSVVRIEVYEPAIPVPSDPQLDINIAYARSNTSTGPTSRALASYLWPGDALGEGLGLLTGNDSVDYPLKVISKYPASDTAPADNTAQLTDGNGMTTSADDAKTQAETTGLRVGGNLLAGVGDGLCNLLRANCPDRSIGLDLPLPLAAAASFDTARSTSTVTLGERVTSTAHSQATGLTLLAGLITIDGLDLKASVSSDGKTAETAGTLAISGLTIAGKRIELGSALAFDGTQTDLPKLPLDLSKLGISLDYLRGTKNISGESGELAAAGLTITLDAAVLRDQLGLGALSGVLSPLVGDLPQIGPVLTGLLKLGTKIVITVGSARATATATPEFHAPPTEPTTDPETEAPDEEPPPATVPPLDPGAFPDPGATPDTGGDPPVGTATPQQPASSPFQLPGLSRLPSLLLLAAATGLAVFGWGFREVGMRFFGSGDCRLGAPVRVPNLRKR